MRPFLGRFVAAGLIAGLAVLASAAGAVGSTFAAARFRGAPRAKAAGGQRRVRRPVHVRPGQLRDAAGRVLVSGTAGLVARLSDVRTEPHADRRRAHERRAARRGHEHAVTRGSRDFKYPVIYIIEPSWWEMTDAEAVNLRAVSRQGRLRHRRRLQDRGVAGRPRLGAVRGQHASG